MPLAVLDLYGSHLLDSSSLGSFKFGQDSYWAALWPGALGRLALTKPFTLSVCVYDNSTFDRPAVGAVQPAALSVLCFCLSSQASWVVQSIIWTQPVDLAIA